MAAQDYLQAHISVVTLARALHPNLEPKPADLNPASQIVIPTS